MANYSGKLSIDLAALCANWRTLSRLAKSSHCGAVIKANAYGLGVFPVFQALQQAGCQEFFVADLKEALAIRSAAQTHTRIYTLQGVALGEEALCAQHGIVPVIVSSEMLDRWLRIVSGYSSPPPCAIKINTGMNRLGLDVAEFRARLSTGDLLRSGATLVMSHLASADDPENPQNEQQWRVFSSVVAATRLQHPSIRFSLANSAAVFLGESWHFDLVRPGIALYGGSSTPLQASIKPVVSLHLPVLQLRDLPVGEAIGYAGAFRAANDLRVAVIAGGYADGLMRAWSPKGCVWSGGFLPVLGRISMDSFVVDASRLEGDLALKVGDYVEVFGAHCALDDHASAAGTTSYEVLTRLGSRWHRSYVGIDTVIEDEALT